MLDYFSKHEEFASYELTIRLFCYNILRFTQKRQKQNFFQTIIVNRQHYKRIILLGLIT